MGFALWPCSFSRSSSSSGMAVSVAAGARTVRLAEAPSHGQPILIYDHACIGSQAYIQLASEVIAREKHARAA